MSSNQILTVWAFVYGCSLSLGMGAVNVGLWGALVLLPVTPEGRRLVSRVAATGVGRGPLLATMLLVLVSIVSWELNQPEAVLKKGFTHLHLLGLLPGCLFVAKGAYRRRFLYGLCVGLAAGLAVTAYQFLQLWGLVPELFAPGIKGFFSNANTWLGVLSLGTLLTRMFTPESRKTRMIIRILPVITLAVTLLAAQRMYGLLAGALFLAVQRNWRRRGLAAVLLVAVAGLLVLSSNHVRNRVAGLKATEYRFGSVYIHRMLARDAMDIWRDAPLLGAGPGSFRKRFKKKHPEYVARKRIFNHAHNQYLQALAETGLAGLAVVLFLFAVIIRQGWRHRHERSGRILLGATAIMLVAGLTDVPFYDSEIVQMYMTLVGVALASAAWGRSKDAEQPANIPGG